MSYLLSVIIPTKNRYIYLKDCIETIISLNSDEIEIVVQDNTEDNRELIEFLEVINWPHIKYFHEKRNLSQTGNSDLALGNSTGKYICYIGDDDTITADLIEVVRWADINDVESCVFPAAVYFWPDVVFKFFKYPTLSFTQKKFQIKTIDPMNELYKSLNEGATSLKKMPKVYHGIVRKSALDVVFSRTGSYFPGPSPDMANATALSLVVKKQVWIEIPLIVSGFSFKSAGGMGTRGAHKARIKDVAQLPVDTEQNWENTIPKIWLASTIWSESCTKALRAMNEEFLIKNINWCYLYAQMLVHNKEYFTDVKPFLNTFSKNIITAILFIKVFAGRSMKFVINLFMTKYGLTNKMIFHDVKTISEAMSLVNQHNKENNYLSYLNNEK